MAKKDKDARKKESAHSKKARDYLNKFLLLDREERTIEFTPLGVPSGENRNVFQAFLSYTAREYLGCRCHD